MIRRKTNKSKKETKEEKTKTGKLWKERMRNRHMEER